MTQSQHDRLRGLIAGYQISQAIAAAVNLGVPLQLAWGPRTAGEIAANLKADAESLCRLLRALAAAGVLEICEGGAFKLTEMGQNLLPDAPRSLANRAKLASIPSFWQAWANLAESISDGVCAFERVHRTTWWTHLASHPGEAAAFDATMSSDSQWMAERIVAACDFGRFSHIVDLGGGVGSLLSAILAANPGVRGTVFDLPEIAGKTRKHLELNGLAGRCDVIGGDLFQTIPQGADAYVLKWVLHDWPDAESIRILENCREGLAPRGRIIIVEHALNGQRPKLGAALLDLNMMVVTGGRERTRVQYENLLTKAGFMLLNAYPTDCQLDILEAAVIA